jgi:hypothetical protein
MVKNTNYTWTKLGRTCYHLAEWCFVLLGLRCSLVEWVLLEFFHGVFLGINMPDLIEKGFNNRERSKGQTKRKGPMLAWYWDQDKVLVAMRQVHINVVKVSNLQGLN